MKTLIKTTITLAAIGVAVKVIKRKNNDNELIITDDYITSKKPFEFKNEPSIKNTTVTNVPVQKITGLSDLPQSRFKKTGEMSYLGK